MARRYSAHLKSTLVPCFILSSVTGIFTAVVIFLFRVCAVFVGELSLDIYSYVRANPILLPLLLLGAALLGTVSYLIFKYVPSCRGGNAQTAITALRGFISLNWITNTVVLFFSSLVTYFSGVPLGAEGTSAQLGAAIGGGTVNIFAKKDSKAWERYIMTGGACGGFAAAIMSPITAIVFAFEEAHRRFSPIIFMAAATATLASTTVMTLLCRAFNFEGRLFIFHAPSVLPPKYFWAPAIVGILCGILAIVYTKIYHITDRIINKKLSRMPRAVKIIALFTIVSLFGFFSSGFIGSGHHLIVELLEGHSPTLALLICYVVIRSIFLLVSNILEIPGGISVPAMAMGAIIGSISAKVFGMLGILPAEYAPVLVIVGVAAFLAAANRIPLTALALAIEAMLGLSNIIPIAIGVTLSFIVVLPLGVKAFSDIVIEKQIHDACRGKEFHTIDAHFTAHGDAFIIGKEVRDILWPANCVVLSVDKIDPHNTSVHEGDVLYLRYKTSDPDGTYKILESILGPQDTDTEPHDIHRGDDKYTIPEP